MRAETIAWVYLLVAGLLEVVWAISLKYTDGLSKPLPTVILIITLILSFIFLSLALRIIPLGTGYAIWTGIGIVGTVIAGIVLFSEPPQVLRLFFVGLILFGIIGLRWIAD